MIIRRDVELVVSTPEDATGQIDEKRRITVRMDGKQIFIKTYFRAHVRTVQIDNGVLRGDFEELCVVPDSADKITVATVAGCIFGAWMGDGVVVRKIDFLRLAAFLLKIPAL